MILLTSQSPAAGFQPHTSNRAAGKNRGEGRERDERGSSRNLEGDSLVKWNKVKEEAWKEWQWVKYENTVWVENSGIRPDTEHRHPDCRWQMYHFQAKKEKSGWRLRCDNVRVIRLVEAGVIDPGEWHHGIHQLAGVGILVTVEPENK